MKKLKPKFESEVPEDTNYKMTSILSNRKWKNIKSGLLLL